MLEIAQHNSCSRLTLSFYNTSTFNISITNHTTWLYTKKNDNCGKTPTRWIELCPSISFFFIFLSRTKREKKFYSHYITHHTDKKHAHTELAKFHTMHYSLFLRLPLFFSLLHNYDNKPLQPIMHNTIGYPSKHNPAIKVQFYPLKLTQNMPTNKTILTTWSFHLSLASFFL